MAGATNTVAILKRHAMLVVSVVMALIIMATTLAFSIAAIHLPRDFYFLLLMSGSQMVVLSLYALIEYFSRRADGKSRRQSAISAYKLLAVIWGAMLILNLVALIVLMSRQYL